VSFNIIKEEKKGQVVFIQICKEIFKKTAPVGAAVTGRRNGWLMKTSKNFSF
jgi:hypothetical protein